MPDQCILLTYLTGQGGTEAVEEAALGWHLRVVCLSLQHSLVHLHFSSLHSLPLQVPQALLAMWLVPLVHKDWISRGLKWFILTKIIGLNPQHSNKAQWSVIWRSGRCPICLFRFKIYWRKHLETKMINTLVYLKIHYLLVIMHTNFNKMSQKEL